MVSIFQVVVELIDLNSGLILECFLIVIDYIELVFIVLHKKASMIDHISHVALKIKHNSTHFLDNSIYWKKFVTHVF